MRRTKMQRIVAGVVAGLLVLAMVVTGILGAVNM